MLTSPRRSVAWALLWELGLIHPIYRFLPTAATGSLDRHRSIFLSFAPAISISVGSSLAAAALDYLWQRSNRPADVRVWLVKSAIASASRAMRQALKISNDEENQMIGTLWGVGAMLAEPAPTLARKKRFLAEASAAGAIDLLRAIAAVGMHQQRIADLLKELADFRSVDFAPPPLITGDDLTAAGASPGPIFKRALDAVYDAQLEGRITTRQQALEMALQIVQRGMG